MHVGGLPVISLWEMHWNKKKWWPRIFFIPAQIFGYTIWWISQKKIWEIKKKFKTQYSGHCKPSLFVLTHKPLKYLVIKCYDNFMMISSLLFWVSIIHWSKKMQSMCVYFWWYFALRNFVSKELQISNGCRNKFDWRVIYYSKTLCTFYICFCCCILILRVFRLKRWWLILNKTQST